MSKRGALVEMKLERRLRIDRVELVCYDKEFGFCLK